MSACRNHWLTTFTGLGVQHEPTSSTKTRPKSVNAKPTCIGPPSAQQRDCRIDVSQFDANLARRQPLEPRLLAGGQVHNEPSDPRLEFETAHLESPASEQPDEPLERTCGRPELHVHADEGVCSGRLDHFGVRP